MQLLELYVGEYRVLRKLRIIFELGDNARDIQSGYCLDFLVGLNGTGKSTVLHLLSRIFTNILSGESTAFPISIELKYRINDKDVTISNLSDDRTDEISGGPLRYNVTEPDGKQGEWHPTKLPLDLRPTRVIVHTTGNEEMWLEELAEDNGEVGPFAEAIPDGPDRFLQEMPGRHFVDVGLQPIDETSPPLLFIRSNRLRLVALCGLIASRKRKRDTGQETLQQVLQSMNLEGLMAFSLRIRLDPAWSTESRPPVIKLLEDAADHQIQQGADRLLVFSFEKESAELEGILELYSTPIEIFQKLNDLCESRPYYDPALREINLFFRVAEPEGADAVKPPLYLFESLSDGEQSFLGRMALFSLFRANELLIMLDEPEVHFNDAWKREIVNMLDGIMRGHSSHALITTHSSIALTDVPKDRIVVLRRDASIQGGASPSAKPPSIDTFGADPSDVLVHVFGTGAATGQRSISYIGAEIARSADVAALESLEKLVAPGYWRYRIELEKERLRSLEGPTS